MCIYIYIYLFIYVYICMYVYIYLYIYIYIREWGRGRLPRCARQEALIELWPAAENAYDFIYLPFNVKQLRTSGHTTRCAAAGAAARATA